MINFFLGFIQTERSQEKRFDAILIEDDTDNRFLQAQSDETVPADTSAWGRAECQGRDRRPLSPYSGAVFLAAPEVEAWFLSDWDNSVGKVYFDRLTVEQNSYFSIRSRRHINERTLTQRYQSRMESYGYSESSILRSRGP